MMGMGEKDEVKGMTWGREDWKEGKLVRRYTLRETETECDK